MALSTLFADPFFTEADRMVDRAMHNMFPDDHHNILNRLAKTAVTRHAADVIETPNEFKVVTDAPGLTPDDVKVELHEGRLTIVGEQKVNKENTFQDGKYHVKERHFSKFSRQFQLPNNISEDKIAASLEKGVLTITLPKLQAPPKPEPKQIAVVAAAE